MDRLCCFRRVVSDAQLLVMETILSGNDDLVTKMIQIVSNALAQCNTILILNHISLEITGRQHSDKVCGIWIYLVCEMSYESKCIIQITFYVFT